MPKRDKLTHQEGKWQIPHEDDGSSRPRCMNPSPPSPKPKSPPRFDAADTTMNPNPTNLSQLRRRISLQGS
ncbi:uncharacterized protein THITE_2106697 [Thermothielavioides terrestris NRRL 8126]|uniref:Uncharacterized protein n=1 Tax=Thermothielavioides terrestris (strain ATCC 38088 / NRRL 8126) TaxID=578455 RepID=G2QR32_THETT|nr:uncharacterized protein THITE_2106697 [Thermothielavioides terrestris NRRL 8126]AEO62484.1 hypothetical protein THITE_2106697 [Thermothielavioides terrestris NRRL 8126]